MSYPPTPSGGVFYPSGRFARDTPLELRQQRTAIMVRLYEAGSTLAGIGALYDGLSRERVRQILSKAGVKMRTPKDWNSRLTTAQRSVNAKKAWIIRRLRYGASGHH